MIIGFFIPNFAITIGWIVNMKNRIKRILQLLLGYHNYLFVFALWIIATLRFQRKEKDFIYFVKMIPDNGILLDIGANIGVMSYYLASRKPSSIVYSFEPVPENITTLRKIIHFFGLKNIRVMEMALGDENKSIEMVLPEEKKVKLHGLSHVVHDTIEDFNVGRRIEVPMRRLDSMDVFSLSKYFVNGIKLDVENFEYFVLKGAHLLLHRHRPIVYAELWDNENRKKCFELIEGYGYEVNVLIGNKLVPFDSKIHRKQTFFFVPED